MLLEVAGGFVGVELEGQSGKVMRSLCMELYRGWRGGVRADRSQVRVVVKKGAGRVRVVGEA